MACFDRARGDTFNLAFGNWFDKFMYAWTTCCLLGHPQDLITLPMIVLIGIGMSIGWGKPIGDALNGVNPNTAYEWYQKGIFKQPYPALALRGFLWGVPLFPLAYFDAHLFLVSIAYMIAMPLAVYIEARSSKNWEWQERFRGLIAGLIIAGLYVIR